ncbi:unnamed protein product [Ectocarpus fasciculatus]
MCTHSSPQRKTRRNHDNDEVKRLPHTNVLERTDINITGLKPPGRGLQYTYLATVTPPNITSERVRTTKRNGWLRTCPRAFANMNTKIPPNQQGKVLYGCYLYCQHS